MLVNPSPYNIASGGIKPGEHIKIDVDWGFGKYIIVLEVEGEKDLIRIPIKASKIDETILIKDYAMGETPRKLPKKTPKGMKDA